MPAVGVFGRSAAVCGALSAAVACTPPADGQADAGADSTGAEATSSAGADICDDGSGGFDLTAYQYTSEGGDAEDTNAGMGNDIPIGLTVYELRDGTVGVGTLVEIADVVVIAPVVRDGADQLVFAQAIDGGENSGITVKLPSEVGELAVGSRMRLIGRAALRLGFVQLAVGDPAHVVVEGTAAVPAPIVLPIDTLLDPQADPQAYESVLVRIETPMVTAPEACPGEFALSSDLWVDDLFLGADAPSPSVGSTYAAIIGPLRAGAGGYEVAPRSLDDLVR